VNGTKLRMHRIRNLEREVTRESPSEAKGVVEKQPHVGTREFNSSSASRNRYKPQRLLKKNTSRAETEETDIIMNRGGKTKEGEGKEQSEI